MEKDALLDPNVFDELWTEEPLAPKIEDVYRGTYKRLQPPDIQGSGYVVKSLEAALWAFYRGADFREGALLAVNLGDDADTTGAVYGQLAGAHYGLRGIPVDWVDKLVRKDDLLAFGKALHQIQ